MMILVVVSYIDSNLLHRVSLSERDRVRLLERVEVDRDGERHGDLVGARVATTDGARAVVDLVRNARSSQNASWRARIKNV